tara:strand:- start:6349 stop:6573 length:225 start_codon:yes stop_codon:yes gene_type:complete
MQSLRLLIRAILLENEEVLGEPDESAEDEREEGHHEQNVVGAVAGAVTPLGTDATYPAHVKKKNKKRLGDKNKK